MYTTNRNNMHVNENDNNKKNKQINNLPWVSVLKSKPATFPTGIHEFSHSEFITAAVSLKGKKILRQKSVNKDCSEKHPCHYSDPIPTWHITLAQHYDVESTLIQCFQKLCDRWSCNLIQKIYLTKS